MMRRRSCIAVGILTLVLASCGDGGPAGGEGFSVLRSQSGNESVSRPYSTVIELSERIAEAYESGTPTHLVAVGEITAVDPGVSMSWIVGSDREAQIVLPFDDPDAMINTFHLRFEASEMLSPQPGNEIGQVTVGLALDPDVGLDAVRDDLLGLGTVVLYLKQSPVFDYQPDAYGLIGGGEMLGLVDEQGVVNFPLIDSSEDLVPETGVTVEMLRSGVPESE